MRTFDNTNSSDAKLSASDVKEFGSTDMWELICKASSESEGWMKSTKALELGNGCLVQTTTQQRNSDGSFVIAEALAFVPCVLINRTYDGDKVVSRKIGV